jgi:predicted kinase
MGLPASGKTYFSQQFAADEDIFFLNIDSLRLAMIEWPQFTPAEHKMVYGTAQFLAEQHLMQGKSMLCNGNYNQRDRRNEMQELAQKYDADFKILWTDVSYEVAKGRILSRQHEIPKEKEKDPWIEVLDKMNRNLQKPESDESFFRIDGTIPYEQQRAQLTR